MHVTKTTEYVGISHPYGALLPQALTQTLHISTTTRCFKDDAYLTFHKRKKLPTDIHSFFGTQYHKILSRSHLQCVELIRNIILFERLKLNKPSWADECDEQAQQSKQNSTNWRHCYHGNRCHNCKHDRHSNVRRSNSFLQHTFNYTAR